MSDEILGTLLIGWGVSAFICGEIWKKHGHSGWSGFLYGVLGGPLAILLSGLKQPTKDVADTRLLARNVAKRCRACAECVPIEALCCAYCAAPFPMNTSDE